MLYGQNNVEAETLCGCLANDGEHVASLVAAMSQAELEALYIGAQKLAVACEAALATRKCTEAGVTEMQMRNMLRDVHKPQNKPR